MKKTYFAYAVSFMFNIFYKHYSYLHSYKHALTRMQVILCSWEVIWGEEFNTEFENILTDMHVFGIFGEKTIWIAKGK